MSAMDGLTILDEQPETTQPDTDDAIETRSRFDHAREITGPLDLELGQDVDRFLDAVLDELDKPYNTGPARLIDRLRPGELDDVTMAALLVFPDETLCFVGSDPTARDSIPLFAYFIERGHPLPPPDDARDAIDLLKPPGVLDAREDGVDVARQGEWFLIPSNQVPVGSVFKPGVNKRPFGASPLANHVPREYAFGVQDAEFMQRFRELAPSAGESIQTPAEALEWIHRQQGFIEAVDVDVGHDIPAWEAVQEIAGTILVRGTLRHRENDHYVENVGEEWHEAETHDVDVFTADEFIERVRID